VSCPRCKADPQPANFGTPRMCAFHDGTFTPGNWNCATMTHLRDLAEELGEISGSCDEHVHTLYIDPSLEELPRGFLVLQVYKRRGRTQGAVYFDADAGGHRELTLELAELILDEFDFDGTRGGR
jgi:hypothetical protein